MRWSMFCIHILMIYCTRNTWYNNNAKCNTLLNRMHTSLSLPIILMKKKNQKILLLRNIFDSLFHTLFDILYTFKSALCETIEKMIITMKMNIPRTKFFMICVQSSRIVLKSFLVNYRWTIFVILLLVDAGWLKGGDRGI